MAYSGDTVRLKVKFVRFDNTLVDPTDVSIKVYEGADNSLLTTITTGIIKENIGIYYYDYVLPIGTSDYVIVEFSGTYTGRPILARDKVSRVFV